MKKKGAFTLIELIIVIVVLGILAVVVIPRAGNFITMAKESVARATLETMADAVIRYHADTGQMPYSGSHYQDARIMNNFLLSPPADVAGWGGPYISDPIGDDPWGRAYMIDFNGWHNNNPNTWNPIMCFGANGVRESNPYLGPSHFTGGDDINVFTVGPGRP